MSTSSGWEKKFDWSHMLLSGAIGFSSAAAASFVIDASNYSEQRRQQAVLQDCFLEASNNKENIQAEFDARVSGEGRDSSYVFPQYFKARDGSGDLYSCRVDGFDENGRPDVAIVPQVLIPGTP